MRWGILGPAFPGAAPVTNIRYTSGPYWRRRLGPGSRCLVPVISFCEWEPTKPLKTPVRPRITRQIRVAHCFAAFRIDNMDVLNSPFPQRSGDT
jgi:putative SOS response-associated peptidase YedK